MKLLRIVLLSLPLAAAFVLPAFSQKKVDIFGYYTIVKAPRAFADISEIHLAGDYGARQKPPIYGLIRLTKEAAKDYRLMRPTLTGKRLTFKTRTVGGVHFEFDGYFTKLFDRIVETRPGRTPAGIALKGTLVKLKGKRILARANLRFSYFAGD